MTLSPGFSGPEVVKLQKLLNKRPPSALPPLAEDGQFGNKTYLRVKEFQRNNNLMADGVVGAATWAALGAGFEMESPPKMEAPRVNCGVGLTGNDGLGLALQQSFIDALVAANASTAWSSAPKIGGPLPDCAREVSPALRLLAGDVYGGSIDFSTVYIINRKGLQDRECVLTFAVPGKGVVQGMMLGTFNPVTNVFIHELAHVWQSQHHPSRVQYMANAALNMKEAYDRNVADPDEAAKKHRAYPWDYPYSAYARILGKPFAEYGADQIAMQAETRIASIVAHFKSVAQYTNDAGNFASLALNHICVEDRRALSVTP